ncbi:hypothetical protein GGR56DRAFT_668311 [Xylariaceae sp. FL0804]|nr:hypothetical protein GGR56DRAFT_668311 [Xylariaceae sp. FL0804]
MADPLSVGKLQAALASATNEVTIAAANLNFDFALMKYEAPKEYQPLGQALTPHRKSEAEGGSQHITAARLGALFEDLCPEVPRLISAFGTRASEIAGYAEARLNPKLRQNWIFSDYAGIDSTSLWAAATSSKASLPVYLLACMLARVWSDADATSLWVEIVAERRRDIASRFQQNEPLHFKTAAAAAQQEITREQLAKWDASARAWLKTADLVKMKQRKQFLLIVNNISMPVDAKSNPYESVVSVWIAALSSMEKLINGEPQAVQDGSTLLGISAWHIYPDMDVFSEQTEPKSVKMEDTLVHPGGVASLGFRGHYPTKTPGVYWSLWLSKHKYYGQPLDLASMAKQWAEKVSAPITRYLADESSTSSLVLLGRRRSGFIETPQNVVEQPFGGFTQMNNLLNMMDPSQRIDLLRRLAVRSSYAPHMAEAYIAFLDGDYWYLASVSRRTQRPATRALRSTRNTNNAQFYDCYLGFVRSRTEITLTQPKRSLTYLFGDADIAAVFIPDGYLTGLGDRPGSTVSYDGATWVTKSHVLKALRGLANAAKVFQRSSMGGASVSPHFLKSQFKPEVMLSYSSEGPIAVTETRALAIISYLEKGTDLVTSSNVGSDRLLGLSTGDSLYIPSRLCALFTLEAYTMPQLTTDNEKMLSDPGSTFQPSEFSRLLGNLGRPGTTILTCPRNPMVRDYAETAFRYQIQQFDGSLTDSFPKTSMHLSFTDWSAQLYQESAVGQRQSDAAHVEAIVSVRDAGSWVGDINIAEAFNHPNVHQLPGREPCDHPQPSVPPADAMVLEKWDQILDCPGGIMVTSSSGNWLARTAIVSMLANHCRLESLHIFICPDTECCWECIQKNIHSKPLNIVYVC